jgi:hypothetical protein
LLRKEEEEEEEEEGRISLPFGYFAVWRAAQRQIR